MTGNRECARYLGFLALAFVGSVLLSVGALGAIGGLRQLPLILIPVWPLAVCVAACLWPGASYVNPDRQPQPGLSSSETG